MPATKRIFSSTILLLVALFLAGCQSEGPGQRGTWKGVVTPVEVSNSHQEKFEVAALQVEQGPSFDPQGHWRFIFPRDPVSGVSKAPDFLGGGTLPLLVQGDLPTWTLFAKDMPISKTITVQGWMVPNMVDVPYVSSSKYGGSVGRDMTRSSFEHVIIIQRYRIEGQDKWIDVPLDPLKVIKSTRGNVHSRI